MLHTNLHTHTHAHTHIQACTHAPPHRHMQTHTHTHPTHTHTHTQAGNQPGKLRRQKEEREKKGDRSAHGTLIKLSCLIISRNPLTQPSPTCSRDWTKTLSTNQLLAWPAWPTWASGAPGACRCLWWAGWGLGSPAAWCPVLCLHPLLLPSAPGPLRLCWTGTRKFRLFSTSSHEYGVLEYWRWVWL